MCISPILIKNPNRGHYTRGSINITDVESCYIPVPCGHCFECSTKKTMQFAQRCYYMSKDYYFYFGMLSYKDGFFEEVLIGDEIFPSAPTSDVKNMVKRLRKSNVLGRPFKYVFVREYGGKKHRLHWHFLLALKKLPNDIPNTGLLLEKLVYDSVLFEWRRNIGSTRKPIYVPLLEYHQKYYRGKLYTNYSCHFVTSNGLTEDRVYYYLVKYLFKHDKYYQHVQMCIRDYVADDRYKVYNNKLRPLYFASTGFGLSEDTNFKVLVNSDTAMIQVGNQFEPIANYYVRKYQTYETKAKLMERYKDSRGYIHFSDDTKQIDRDRDNTKQEFYDRLFNRDLYDMEDFL